MHHVWYSQPTSDEHPITAIRPLRNGCIWQHYGARETHQTLKTISAGPHVSFRDIQSSVYICIMFDTPNQPVRNATLLPTGHWGMAAFDSNMGHVKHIKHWKPCLWAPMCHLGINNRLLIYALCVILPTGQWGIPHYSQPTTEEWLHLTATWGTLNTSNITNYIWGPSCVILGQIIVSWYIHFVWYSQSASGEHPLLPTDQWGTAAVWGDRAHQTLKTISGGPDVSFGHK